jgi:acetate kinase
MAAWDRVLVLNAGSSSLKWSVLRDGDETCEREGTEAWGDLAEDARLHVLERVVAAAGKVDAIGHRVVDGGPHHHEATLVDDELRAAISALVAIDPLHEGPALAGMAAASAALPNVPQVAAFDTAFHATIPDEAAVYPLPAEWTRRFGLRRAGFHGLSVAYAVSHVARALGAMPSRLLVLHLGSGCSITAVKDGRSVDTTMGASVLEGVMMGTRSGSIDPGVLLALQLRHGVDARELHDALQHRSGLLGVSGVSSDLRAVRAAAAAGSAPASLAVRCFVRSVVRHAGAMCAVLGGVDAIAFTGGIGEHDADVRSTVARALESCGVSLDSRANADAAGDACIATTASRVRVYVVRAREDVSIAREVRSLLARRATCEGAAP